MVIRGVVGSCSGCTFEFFQRKSANQNATAYSSTASATTDAAPSPPAAPSGLSATAVAKTQINLSWTDNANNETGFKIERSKRVNTAFAQNCYGRPERNILQ